MEHFYMHLYKRQKQDAPFRFKKQLVFAILLFLIVAACFFSLAARALYDPAVPFLKTDSRANWIQYPLALSAIMRSDNFLDLTAEFTKDFELDAVPPMVRLDIRAYEEHSLLVNGNILSGNPQSRIKWKKTSRYYITDFLKEGTNTISIRVDCDLGNPAVWLYSKDLPENIKTDSSWLVSMADGPYTKAALADDCRFYPATTEIPTPLNALIRKAPMLILFFILSFAVFSIHIYIKRREKLSSIPALEIFTLTPGRVLLISIILWTVLFINNTPKLPYNRGFDAGGHLSYFRYVLDNHRIPYAGEGWETYHPPLFYVCAVLLFPFRVFFASNHSTYVLKFLPFISGLGQVVLAYFAGRILFPKSRIKQALTVAFVALIPMNIYISTFFSNESSGAFLIALAIFITFMIIERDRTSYLMFCMLGIALGLALLTKVTAFSILPVITVVILYKQLHERKDSLVAILGKLCLLFLVVAAVAGWYYVRNFIKFGKPIVMNTEFNWWQDPGFHTYNYFCQFSKVFIHPYYASFYSFFDSLYSSFWSDSLFGSAIEYVYSPPWDYEYASALLILSVPVIFFMFVGIVRVIAKIVFNFSKSWLLVIGSISVALYGIAYFNLRYPHHSCAKSFYFLYTIIPIGLIFALGFEYCDKWLRNRNLFLPRSILFGWFGTLALTVFFSLLIRPSQIQKRPNLDGFAPMGEKVYYEQVLQADPDNYHANITLANMYFQEKDFTSAIKYAETALMQRPNWPDVLDRFAFILNKKPDAIPSEKYQAVQYANYSCRLTGYMHPPFLLTLADAYAASERKTEAINTADRALKLAVETDKHDLANRISERLEYYKSALPSPP